METRMWAWTEEWMDEGMAAAMAEVKGLMAEFVGDANVVSPMDTLEEQQQQEVYDTLPMLARKHCIPVDSLQNEVDIFIYNWKPSQQDLAERMARQVCRNLAEYDDEWDEYDVLDRCSRFKNTVGFTYLAYICRKAMCAWKGLPR